MDIVRKFVWNTVYIIVKLTTELLEVSKKDQKFFDSISWGGTFKVEMNLVYKLL